MKLSKILGVGMVIVCLSTIVSAEEPEGEEATCLTKLGRGLENTFTCWMEVPDDIAEVSQETDNSISGVLFGTIRGLGMGLSRLGYGVADTATFVVPEYDKPILDSEYKF